MNPLPRFGLPQTAWEPDRAARHFHHHPIDRPKRRDSGTLLLLFLARKKRSSSYIFNIIPMSVYTRGCVWRGRLKFFGWLDVVVEARTGKTKICISKGRCRSWPLWMILWLWRAITKSLLGSSKMWREHFLQFWFFTWPMIHQTAATNSKDTGNYILGYLTSALGGQPWRYVLSFHSLIQNNESTRRKASSNNQLFSGSI